MYFQPTAHAEIQSGLNVVHSKLKVRRRAAAGTVGGGCVRHTMAGLAANYVQQYVRHIVDGTPPKAEYVRHFEARTPRALGGQ